MKKNLSTRIKRNLSRIKSLCIFITDVYLSLDSEFIVNYIESKNIVVMSDNRTIELHDNATYIENYGDVSCTTEMSQTQNRRYKYL